MEKAPNQAAWYEDTHTLPPRGHWWTWLCVKCLLETVSLLGDVMLLIISLKSDSKLVFRGNCEPRYFSARCTLLAARSLLILSEIICSGPSHSYINVHAQKCMTTLLRSQAHVYCLNWKKCLQYNNKYYKLVDVYKWREEGIRIRVCVCARLTDILHMNHVLTCAVQNNLQSEGLRAFIILCNTNTLLEGLTV